jgi:ligand-binding SRPBCC domain-containing protein
VRQDFQTVFSGFDEKLFRRLAPPYPRLRLLRFDGSQPGDLVEIELLTGFRRFRWTSRITERQVTDTEAWFTDQGEELPPPLRFWHHRHLVTRRGTGATIHDLITYRTRSRLLDLLLYPLLWAQFAYRKPVYRKAFS